MNNSEQKGIGGLTPAQTINHLNAIINQNNDKPKGLFKVQPADDWISQAKSRPVPKMLFDEFWFEGELCILFAENGVGKSLLAVQIANSISNGIPIAGFRLQSTQQPVLYFDFELSDKQFENRYSVDYQNHYKFSDNFLRAEIDSQNADYKEHGFLSFEDYLSDELEQNIIETGTRVIIIDNITYLKTETEKAKDALPLMKRLIQLKREYHLSILILAHTPKRDLSQPITRNHLQGSKHLSNLTDSIFAIGESHLDTHTRYLKQIKARSCEMRYDAGNVVMCKVHQPFNFVLFEHTGFATEKEHLKSAAENKNGSSALEDEVAALWQSDESLTTYGIAKKLCPEGGNFNSFKVKVDRIIKRISNT